MTTPDMPGAATPLVGPPGATAAAIAELREYHRTLGAELRGANQQAKAGNPLAGFRPRSRNGRAAVRAVLNLLPPEAQEAAARAEKLRVHRDNVRRAADLLVGEEADDIAGHILAGINLDKMADDGACPTFRVLVDRWKANGGRIPTNLADRQREELLTRIDQIRKRLDKLNGGPRG